MDLLEKLNEFSLRPISIFAVGGTALTLLGLKDSTRDIDFNTESDKIRGQIEDLFERIGFKPIGGNKWETEMGFHIDLFSNGYIFCVQMPEDYAKISREIKNFGKLRLLAISPYDLIITKLARGDGRDFSDIKMLFRKESINLKKLAGRYIETMENSFVPMAKSNMLLLLKERLEEWGFKSSKEAIRMVEEWKT